MRIRVMRDNLHFNLLNQTPTWLCMLNEVKTAPFLSLIVFLLHDIPASSLFWTPFSCEKWSREIRLLRPALDDHLIDNQYLPRIMGTLFNWSIGSCITLLDSIAIPLPNCPAWPGLFNTSLCHSSVRRHWFPK